MMFPNYWKPFSLKKLESKTRIVCDFWKHFMRSVHRGDYVTTEHGSITYAVFLESVVSIPLPLPSPPPSLLSYPSPFPSTSVTSLPSPLPFPSSPITPLLSPPWIWIFLNAEPAITKGTWSWETGGETVHMRLDVPTLRRVSVDVLEPMPTIASTHPLQHGFFTVHCRTKQVMVSSPLHVFVFYCNNVRVRTLPDVFMCTYIQAGIYLFALIVYLFQ